MPSVQHFVSTKYNPPLRLRRTTSDAGILDEAFIDGAWRPTKIIVDYMFGHDDYVEPIESAE
jgi:hypothetical protein